MVTITWTKEKEKAVLDAVEKYMVKHEITCAETVMQCDDPYIDATTVMAEIAEILKPEYSDDEEE